MVISLSEENPKIITLTRPQKHKMLYPNTLPDPNPTCTNRLQDLVVENLDEE